MVSGYTDIDPCKILSNLPVSQSLLKRRSLLAELYTLKKSANHVYRYLPFFTDFLIDENNVKM